MTSTLRIVAAVGLALAATGLAGAAETAIVKIPSGAAEADIQTAIVKLGKQGGGRIEISPGSYELRRGLRFQNTSGVTLVGRPGTRLVLAPEIVATAAQDAAKGAKLVMLESVAGLLPGMHCEVQAPGHSYETPEGKKMVCAYFGLSIAAVDGNRLTTTGPLAYPVPKGAKIIHVYNAISIGGHSAALGFQGLEIDLARDRWPVAPINHTEHCAIFAGAAFDYKKGPLGPPIEKITVRDCVLRGAHHRGVAWYGVVRSEVTGCQVENTGAEGIDIDHFCFFCRIKNNTVRRAPVGIELNDPSDCLVENNRIEDCQRGLNLWRWCDGAHLNVRNVFRGNQVLRCKSFGIFCGPKTSQSDVAENLVDGSGAKGIHIAGDENRVEKNTVRGCRTEAILVSGQRNVLRGNRCEASGVAVKNTGKDNRIKP